MVPSDWSWKQRAWCTWVLTIDGCRLFVVAEPPAEFVEEQSEFIVVSNVLHMKIICYLKEGMSEFLVQGPSRLRFAHVVNALSAPLNSWRSRKDFRGQGSTEFVVLIGETLCEFTREEKSFWCLQF